MSLVVSLVALWLAAWALWLVGATAHRLSVHLDGLDKERVWGPPHGPAPRAQLYDWAQDEGTGL